MGQKKEDAFGLFDVHSNVWEWYGDHLHRADVSDSGSRYPAPSGSSAGARLKRHHSAAR